MITDVEKGKGRRGKRKGKREKEKGKREKVKTANIKR
jgi:hypothetical protein